MFCSQCGKKNVDAANFCYACGAALSAGRPTAAAAPPVVPSASLPVVLRTIAVAFLLLGGASAVIGVATGAERLGGGDTSVPALQNFSTALGGVVVALYGFLILRRHRLALGRWWFLAAWAMNLLSPIGLFFLVLIIVTTVTIRKKYAGVFGGTPTRLPA